MSVAFSDTPVQHRSRAWKWWVCILLLLATTVNYMDRLTLNQMSDEIMKAFSLNPRHYGQLESAFGSAFAIGAIIAGWLADRMNVRWLYAIAVLAWSLAGFCTGLATGFVTLLIFRFLLGLAEAGNWPCALRTTQHILPPDERTMGNSLLQSGAALGAVIIPFVVLPFLHLAEGWRYPFLIIGGIGMVWALLWLGSVRQRDLERKATPSVSLLPVVGLLVLLLAVDVGVHIYFTPVGPPSLGGGIGLLGTWVLTPGRMDASWVPVIVKFAVTGLGMGGVFLWLWSATREDADLDRVVFFRRFWVLALVVVMINATWHYFRVWLPLFLRRVHHYEAADVQWFSAGYYISTNIGSLAAGLVTLWLAKRYLPVHWSRMIVFGGCALLTTLSVVAAYLPAGPLLLAVFLVIGFGALGLFPNYYSFTQELTTRHQGKLTGSLGCICWLAMSLLHEVVGDSIVRTGSYSEGVAAAGLAPLVALVALLLFWGKSASTKAFEPPLPLEPAPTRKLHPEAIQPAAPVGVQH